MLKNIDIQKKMAFLRSITQFRWRIQFIFTARHTKTMSIIHAIPRPFNQVRVVIILKTNILQMSRIKHCTYKIERIKKMNKNYHFSALLHWYLSSYYDSFLWHDSTIHISNAKPKVSYIEVYIINVLTSLYHFYMYYDLLQI